jgi:type IV pilus assembly protein PilC
MPNYSYKAKDRLGEISDGLLFADNINDLRNRLRSNGLYLTDFEKRRDTVGEKQQPLFRPRKVKFDDMVVMSRQLATLVRAGLPIVESLGTLAQQTENPLLSDALRAVRLNVTGGASLAEAFRMHPKVFSELYCSLVEAGEVGGVLDQTLEIAADQFAKEADLRQQVKGAMVYPKLVVAACFGVIAFMILVIVPVFKQVYGTFHAQLPAITLLLISLSDIGVHYGFLVIIAFVLIWLGIRNYKQTPKGKRLFDKVSLKMPITGKLMRKIAISRFTQTFGGATKGGIPILKALAVSANTSGNEIIKSAILSVATHVQEGTPLAPPLDDTGEFPPLVIRMIAAGEKAGNLPLMLDEMTRFYERDIEYAVQKLTRLLEPLMTIAVGGLVLFVLLSLYWPVFNLSHVIGK